MNCNNHHCLWNAYDQCCHESEEGHANATPNELDCPSSLRADFQEQLGNLVAECKELTHKRNMKELIAIKSFMERQRA